ncbi:MAG: zinc ribbon domain-containing protein [Anaerolineales bacterium]|jgi:hypothetical protein
MSLVERFAAWFYQLLVGLYPRNYRVVFEEEMQDVFTQTVSEAAGGGSVRQSFIFLRELKDYPGNLLREHWLNLQGKEVVMVTGPSSMNASLCPRCGALRSVEARYCTNCGKAFIPIHTYLIEQVKNIFESRITLVAFGILVLLVFSQRGEYLITSGIFHPVALLIMGVGVGIGSIIFGWMMGRKTTNRNGFLLILLFSVYLQLLFVAVEKIDWTYLHSEVTTEQSISYEILGVQTCISRFGNGNIEDISDYSACDPPIQSDFKWYRRFNEELTEPGIMIERSWEGALFYPYMEFLYPYQWMFIAYVVGIVILTYRIFQRIRRKQLVST